MNMNELKQIKEIILNKMKELSEPLDIKEEQVDKDGDETDDAQGTFIINMMYEQNDRKKTLFFALKSALDKINHSEYGICEECEEEIPYKRLLICPEAKYCIKCAELMEKEAKNYRNGIITE